MVPSLACVFSVVVRVQGDSWVGWMKPRLYAALQKGTAFRLLRSYSPLESVWCSQYSAYIRSREMYMNLLTLLSNLPFCSGAKQNGGQEEIHRELMCWAPVVCVFCRMTPTRSRYRRSLGSRILNGDVDLNCFFSAPTNILVYMSIWLLVEWLSHPSDQGSPVATASSTCFWLSWCPVWSGTWAWASRPQLGQPVHIQHRVCGCCCQTQETANSQISSARSHPWGGTLLCVTPPIHYQSTVALSVLTWLCLSPSFGCLRERVARDPARQPWRHNLQQHLRQSTLKRRAWARGSWGSHSSESLLQVWKTTLHVCLYWKEITTINMFLYQLNCIMADLRLLWFLLWTVVVCKRAPVACEWSEQEWQWGQPLHLPMYRPL